MPFVRRMPAVTNKWPRAQAGGHAVRWSSWRRQVLCKVGPGIQIPNLHPYAAPTCLP
jgi:hypothetical protein